MAQQTPNPNPNPNPQPKPQPQPQNNCPAPIQHLHKHIHEDSFSWTNAVACIGIGFLIGIAACGSDQQNNKPQQSNSWFG